MRYVIRAVHPLLYGLVWLSWTVMAVMMAIRLTHWTEQWGPQAALAWVRQSTGIPIYADDIRVRPVRGEVTLSGVRLGEAVSPEATADRVHVAGLWTSRIRIEADRPYLRLAQQSDGKWNITQYIPEGGEPTEPTRMFDIRVRDGEVDLEALVGRSQLRRSVSSISGRVLVSGQALSLRVKARERQGRIDAYGVGFGPSLSLRLHMESLDVTDIPELFGVSQVRLAGAQANGTVWVSVQPSGVQVAGEVTGSSPNGVVSAPGVGAIPLQASQARVSFSNDQIRFRGAAQVLGGSIEAEGGGLVAGDPDLQMTVRLRSVRPDRVTALRRMVPADVAVRAPVSGDVQLAIGPQGFTMRAVDVRSAASFRSQDIQLTQADVDWGQDIARWRIAARLADARIRSHGEYTPKGISAQLMLRNLQLSQLRIWPYAVSGVANLDAVLTGRPNRPEVQVACTVRNARYQKYHAPLVSLRADGSLDELDIAASVEAGALGAIRIDGVAGVTGQTMDARITWRQMDAEALARLLEVSDLPAFKAMVSLYGRAEGRWADPAFHGNITASDVLVNGFEFDSVSCDIQATRNRLELRHAQVRRGLSEVLADAQVERPLDTDRRITVSGQLRTIDLHDMMEIAGTRLSQPDLGGAFDGLLQARWDGKSWWASGVVESAAITVDDLIVSGVHLEADWRDGALVLRDSRASVGQGTLGLEGSWEPGDGWTAKLDARGVPLSWVERYLPDSTRQPVLGVFDASVTARGTKALDAASASLTASRCSMDAFELTEAAATADFKDGILTLGPLKIDSPYGSLAIESGTYHLADAKYSVSGRLQLHGMHRLSEAVQDSRLAARNGASLVSALAGLQVNGGALDVQMRADGQKDRFSVDGDVSVEGVVVKGLDTGRLLAHVSGSLDTQLRVTGGQYEGLGGVGLLNGEFNRQSAQASLDLFSIDAGALGRVVPGFAALSGQVDVSVLMDGPYNSPDLTGSLVVSNPGYGNLRAKLLVSQNIQLKDGYLTIPELVLKQSSDALRMSARIPMTPGGFAPDTSRPMEAQATADRQPLHTLLEFMPLSGLSVSGDWEAKLTVGGAINNPTFAGEVKLTDGAVGLDRLSTALKHIDGSIQFYGDRVHASVTAANSHNAKGRLLLTGEVNHLTGTPEVEAALSARQFMVHESNASGVLKERIDGELTGDITVTGPLKAPVVSGTMTSKRTRISLPGAAALPAGEPTPPTYNPVFQNLTLVIEDGVFRLPRIDARGVGRVVLNGTLSSPELSGGVNVTHGKLYFPTTVFRVEPPATVQLAYPVPGPDPFVLTTNMRASSRMRIYGGYGLGRSYLVRMELTGPLVGGTAQMRFSSEPPTASEQEIIDALGVGILKNVLDSGSTGKLEQELGNIVAASLLSPVFSPLESGLETAFGLSEVRLDYRQNEAMSVMLVKQLGGPFSLSYWRMFDRLSPQYELRLLYDAPAWLGVMRSTQFSLMINERQETTLGFIAGLRF